MRAVRERVPLNKIAHAIRAAQVVLQYGVGAMIDFPDQTLMTAAPECWSGSVRHIHDERLEKALGVSYFGMPRGRDDRNCEGVSYVRFPRWYFCPECRRFRPIEDWEAEHRDYCRDVYKGQPGFAGYMGTPRCTRCRHRPELVVTRIVVACSNGHIDDFPWVRWVHDRNYRGQMPICAEPRLQFSTRVTASEGLEGLEVSCETCSARASLAGAFDREEGKTTFQRLGAGYGCSGFHPWKNRYEACDMFPRAIQRGASSAYFPKVVSSLVIPPYSDRLNARIESSHEYGKCLARIEDYEESQRIGNIASRLDKWAEAIACEVAVDPNMVKRVLTRRWLTTAPEEYTTDSERYRLEEYLALIGEVGAAELGSDDFVREVIHGNRYGIPGVTCVSLIHKVREVRALTGFTRLDPPGSSDLGAGENGFVSVKERTTKWYPAYEVRGEGVFVQFDHDQLNEWQMRSPSLKQRASELTTRYRETRRGRSVSRVITPRFLLLHSLAHALIRQMSFECGYTCASLRERVYCSESPSNPMSGVLVYTASGDSEGTLGGLVRQGHTDSLPGIFAKAVEASKVCSNDPVCVSSDGQGRDALNLAACHACLLLPETSCEEFNIFLDRAMISGTFEQPEVGFFSSWNPS
jgi:hypothetical protein